MKRALFVLVVLAAAVGGTGCAGPKQHCSSCGGPGGGYAGGGPGCGKGGLLESFAGGMHHGGGECTTCANCQTQPMPQQPMSSPGAVAYPYYTNRGPRDFLLNNPPSIGPY